MREPSPLFCAVWSGTPLLHLVHLVHVVLHHLHHLHRQLISLPPSPPTSYCTKPSASHVPWPCSATPSHRPNKTRSTHTVTAHARPPPLPHPPDLPVAMPPSISPYSTSKLVRGQTVSVCAVARSGSITARLGPTGPPAAGLLEAVSAPATPLVALREREICAARCTPQVKRRQRRAATLHSSSPQKARHPAALAASHKSMLPPTLSARRQPDVPARPPPSAVALLSGCRARTLRHASCNHARGLTEPCRHE